MKYIAAFIVLMFEYWTGFIMAKRKYEKQTLIFREKSVESEIKAARVNMVIRAYRNQLLREETKLRALPKDKQEKNALKYINVKAKLQLIRQIEEDVAHEMQEI